ncbi:MAG TPA: sigma-70 family RNA polymerase sigma factor [Longimicrobium sp.]|nr:sigma-70 family RNA polymerase sigma factor [Longimicrobium sp.]
MPDPQDPEALLRENLATVDRIVASLCRRQGMRGDDADEVASWTRLRLVEDDYAILRKFRGESSLSTYLTVVVAMLFREYRVREWGRWRPSAAARRLGPLAVRLEMLVLRDGYTLDQAGQRLRAAGETDLPDLELARLLGSVPRRGLPRPVRVGVDAPGELADPAGAEDRVTAEEGAERRRRVEEALRRAVDALDPEDRLIVRLRVWEDTSVADIARGLGLPQKPLYRRLQRVFDQLRRRLESGGLTRDAAVEALREWEA